MHKQSCLKFLIFTLLIIHIFLIFDGVHSYSNNDIRYKLPNNKLNESFSNIIILEFK